MISKYGIEIALYDGMKEIKLKELNISTETMKKLKEFVDWYIQDYIDNGTNRLTWDRFQVADKLFELGLIPDNTIYDNMNFNDKFFRVDITILQSFKAFTKIAKLLNRNIFVGARSKERMPFWINKTRKELEKIYSNEQK